jgi:hypothetical protein
MEQRDGSNTHRVLSKSSAPHQSTERANAQRLPKWANGFPM